MQSFLDEINFHRLNSPDDADFASQVMALVRREQARIDDANGARSLFEEAV